MKTQMKCKILQNVLKRMMSTELCIKALGRKVIILQRQNTRMNKQLSDTIKRAAEPLQYSSGDFRIFHPSQ